jgi:acyl carrier protein
MTQAEVLSALGNEIARISADKGIPAGVVDADTVLLGGNLNLDSLDLAGIVVQLQEATAHDPFADGFIEFRTAGELADLFANK